MSSAGPVRQQSLLSAIRAACLPLPAAARSSRVEKNYTDDSIEDEALTQQVGRFAPKTVSQQYRDRPQSPGAPAFDLRIENKRIAKICQTAGMSNCVKK
jgi:hypothetical protein